VYRMDEFLLTEFGAHERLGLENFANDPFLDRRSDAVNDAFPDRRSEAAKEVIFADLREREDSIGIDEIRRENDVRLGADLDLADEGGYRDSGSDRLDVPLRLFWR
jgi:hypothetical protein